jgi:hypothetical protein
LPNEAVIASAAPLVPGTPHLRRVLGRMDLVLLFVVAVFNLNVVPSIAANGGVPVWLRIISLAFFPARQVTSILSFEVWMFSGTLFLIGLAAFLFFVHGRRKTVGKLANAVQSL